MPMKISQKREGIVHFEGIPVLDGNLQIGLPTDATFEESAPLVEGLSRHFFDASLRRYNPAIAHGGTATPDMVWGLWLVLTAGGVIGVSAFAKRFFELLAEDTHAG